MALQDQADREAGAAQTDAIAVEPATWCVARACRGFSGGVAGCCGAEAPPLAADFCEACDTNRSSGVHPRIGAPAAGRWIGG